MEHKIAIIMGSDSDVAVAESAVEVLKQFAIKYEVRVISAHRTPDKAAEFSKGAKQADFDVIIAIAGMAAHLAGVLAAFTAVPVIGVPVKASLDGMDALLAMVQMPQGIPVATVAIDGGANAAILAAQMLATSDSELYDKLLSYKASLAAKCEQKDANIIKKFAN